MIKIIIDTVNSSFEGELLHSEVARIVEEASLLVSETIGNQPLFDINGGKVGILMNVRVGYGELVFSNKQHVCLTLETENSAFAQGSWGKECIRILKESALKIRDGHLNFNLSDINGNIVGSVNQGIEKDKKDKISYHEQNMWITEGSSTSKLNSSADVLEVAGPGLYAELLAAGIEMDSHESDLYVAVNKESTAILGKYPVKKSNSSVFRSNIDGSLLYDVPFSYEPYWENKSKASAKLIASKKSSFTYVDLAAEKNYDGIVLGVTPYHIVLSLGPAALIIHQKDIDRIPQPGEYMVVKFVGGKGLVQPEEPVKAKGLDR
jgi:hypothetical protein